MASQSLDIAPFVQRWQRLGKRQQTVTLIIGSVAVAWVMDGIALRPLRSRVRELRRQVRETEQRLVEASVASDQAQAVTRAFSAYEPYVKPSGSSESELASVLSEVESAVRQSGMTLLNLRPVSGRQGTAQTISVTVEGEASPHQLVQLLDLVQRSTRLLKVTELTVRVSETKTLRTSMVISKLLLK